MRVESARYVGTDNKGQKFDDRRQQCDSAKFGRADRRYQRHVRPARAGARPAADCARTRRATISTRSKWRSTARCGSRARTATASTTRDVTVDLKQRKLASSGPVAGQMRLGQFQAGQLKADLGEPNRRARRRCSLENRARGGQMMAVRSIGIILAAGLWLRRGTARRRARCGRSSRSRRSRDITATRRSTSPPTASKCRTAPTARSSPATSMPPRPS